MRDVLITAGATRNPIDSMRFISAHSSGRTGKSLAEALLAEGARVKLLGSPQAVLLAPARASAEVFGSTRDLMKRMEIWIKDHPQAMVIHSAAVGDYEARAQAGKISSGSEELQLRLQPTPKILDQVRSWAPKCFLVSFKAAAPGTTLVRLAAIATAQLQRTHCDLVFGNIIGALEDEVVLVSTKASHSFPCREDGMRALVQHSIQALRH